MQVRQVAGDDEHVRRRVPIGEAFQHGEDARQRALTRDDVGHEVEAERCELVGVTSRGNHGLAADGAERAGDPSGHGHPVDLDQCLRATHAPAGAPGQDRTDQGADRVRAGCSVSRDS